MRFVSLRISGFKSFVDRTEAAIEPGLTGVVGPNGCGKSNLLEALRWVMGAASAKALRAGGMDDVIFAGASNRPARNFAEVTLVVDNADRRAPSLFNDADSLEITRRITKGGGSSYRVNGREVRARDVQLLFADASSGANSPALVRQGQISELIAAKPENRRRVLEEAAGVSGLRARRHEAELKLKGAEANLERLDDALGDSERRLDALRRQAREATRYKKVSMQIRALEARAHRLRWLEAKAACETAQADSAAAAAAVAEAERAAAAANARVTTSTHDRDAAREEDGIARAVAGGLQRKRDELARRLADAKSAIETLETRLKELAADAARETERGAEAARETARLEGEIARLNPDDDAAQAERLAIAETAATSAETARDAAEAALAKAVEAAAAARARRAAAEDGLKRANARLETLARGLQTLDAEGESESENVDAAATAAQEARARAEAAETALTALRQAQTKAEAARDKAADKAEAARETRAAAAARAATLRAEREALEKLLAADAKTDALPVADEITVAPGYERALAAALGEDLSASRAQNAAVRWTAAGVGGPALPGGARALSELVEAPAELAARLGQIGVVEDDAGDTLAAALAPGQRLVSAAGRLWRWDGLRASAEAPAPGAARLERRNRLAALVTESETADAEADAARAHETKADKAAADAADKLKAAREAAREAETETRKASQAADAADARAQTLSARAAERGERRARLTAERDEAAAGAAQCEADLAQADAPDASDETLASLRAQVESARATAVEARAAVAAIASARDAERARRAALGEDLARWRARAAASQTDASALKDKCAETEARLAEARAAPPAIETDAATAAAEHAVADKRRRQAADALGEVEARVQAAERDRREADKALGEARETRAAAQARAEAAADRLEEAVAMTREALGVGPETLNEDPETDKLDQQGVEKKLADLRRARDRLGAVNLTAEDEAGSLEGELKTLNDERADLVAAISKLRAGVSKLNDEGRRRLSEAFDVIDGHFRKLFETLFGGGEAKLALVDSDDPLEAGLDIHVSPPGKRLGALSLMSGGEQALTATALIFAVFLANPAPLCALDEVDAPLDDANVDRFCRLLDEMRRLTDTRFVVITHNAVTMSRMDRLYGVTMAERGVSQLVSVDLAQAERLAAAE